MTALWILVGLLWVAVCVCAAAIVIVGIWVNDLDETVDALRNEVYERGPAGVEPDALKAKRDARKAQNQPIPPRTR